MNEAHKLTEAALAIEEIKRTEEALNLLRQILGTYECERNTTVGLLEGYLLAMKRVARQADL